MESELTMWLSFIVGIFYSSLVWACFVFFKSNDLYYTFAIFLAICAVLALWKLGVDLYNAID